MYILVYNNVDALNYSGVHITRELYKNSVDAYKEVAFMIENNEFFRYYLTIFFDNWDIYVRIFEDRMYINHSITQGDLNAIRQWKSR